jgi:hypothetical protein
VYLAGYLPYGDIQACFDRLDHSVLLTILAKKIQDQRFLRLIRWLLEAGYLEMWTYFSTPSGCPQGSILSPVLANVYLNQLDIFATTILQPQYTRGTARRRNPPYCQILKQITRMRQQGKKAEAKRLYREAQQLPSVDPNDPNYRRFRYLRYADDWLIGFVGTKEEAETIKTQMGEFLHDHLKLELSPEKTLITHAQTESARFLGYEITIGHANDKQDHHGRRNLNGRIQLRVPHKVITTKCQRYMQGIKPIHRAELLQDDDFSIMSQYQAEYRGIAQYYFLACNVHRLGRLQGVMRTSLLKTLAAKHRTTVMTILRKYQATTQTPFGPMKCLEMKVQRGDDRKPLITRFGGIPLRRQKKAILIDSQPIDTRTGRNELLKRLLADTCEICGYHGNCQVHHIRKLADLHVKGRKEKPRWMHIMAARRRKTLVVCPSCHQSIHAGTYNGPSLMNKKNWRAV